MKCWLPAFSLPIMFSKVSVVKTQKFGVKGYSEHKRFYLQCFIRYRLATVYTSTNADIKRTILRMLEVPVSNLQAVISMNLRLSV